MTDDDWGRPNPGWGAGNFFEGASWPKAPGLEAGGPFEEAMLRSRLVGLEGTRAWLEWMKAAGMLEMVVSSMGQFMGPGGGSADADEFLRKIDEQIAQVRSELAGATEPEHGAETAAESSEGESGPAR